MEKLIALEEDRLNRLIDAAYANGAVAMRDAIVKHFTNRDYQHVARIIRELPCPPKEREDDARPIDT